MVQSIIRGQKGLHTSDLFFDHIACSRCNGPINNISVMPSRFPEIEGK